MCYCIKIKLTLPSHHPCREALGLQDLSVKTKKEYSYNLLINLARIPDCVSDCVLCVKSQHTASVKTMGCSGKNSGFFLASGQLANPIKKSLV